MPAISYTAILSDRQRSGRTPHVRVEATSKLVARDVSFWYGPKQALFDINLAIPERSVMALIGPSGCGKSTVRCGCLNRMNDLVPTSRLPPAGPRPAIDGQDIYDPRIDPVVTLRRTGRHGLPAAEPRSRSRVIHRNVAFGLRLERAEQPRQRRLTRTRASAACARAALWDEVKDRLDDQAGNLSGGQQPEAVHRPGAGHRPRGAADGRTGQRPRPEKHEPPSKT